MQLVKKYGIYVGLTVSLLLNVLLIATRPNLSKVVGAADKANFEQFARTVTSQFLDSSYISYGANTLALMSGELAPSLRDKLQADGTLPRSKEEIAATERELSAKREVTAVRIDSVDLGEPDSNSFVPADVKGTVAVHSADESGPSEQNFHFKLLIGTSAQTNAPLLVRMEELK
jgi:hypothetical protein